MFTNSIPVLQGINNKGQTFVNSDGTSTKDLFIAGANGSRLYSIAVTSTDIVARLMNLFYYDGSVFYLIGSITIPALSGFDGYNPSVSIIQNLNSMIMYPPPLLPFMEVDNNGNLIIELMFNEKIQAVMTTAVTATKTISVFSSGRDY